MRAFTSSPAGILSTGWRRRAGAGGPRRRRPACWRRSRSRRARRRWPGRWPGPGRRRRRRVTGRCPGGRSARTRAAGSRPGNRALVADLDVQVGPGARAASTMTDAAGREPQRVADQVVDRLADPVRVDAGVRPGADLDPAGDPGRGQPGTGQLGAAREQGADVRPLQPQAEPVLVAPGQQQQVVGEPGQPLRFRVGAADGRGQLGRARGRDARRARVPPAAPPAGCAARGWRRRRRHAAGPAPAAAGRAARSWCRPGRRSRPWWTAPRRPRLRAPGAPPRSDTAATCRRSRSTGDRAARASP